MIFAVYLAVALIVVFFSIKCADYVDMLDKKTDISGAFIGGVILAAVTSLPEMVTSISAIGIGSEELIVGNVLGSNLFNLCIFGGLVLFTSKGFRASKVGSSHVITLLCIMGAYITMGAVLFGNIGAIPNVSVNAASFVLVVLYAISCKFMASDESETDDEEEISLSLKQIVTRFVLCALGLVLSSIAITYITDVIDETYNLGTSFAGAIFLGIATSIPELTSSISLVKKRNYNAMIGNVVGSCMFNFIIFSLADIIAFRRNVFVTSPDARLMVVLGAVSAAVTFAALIAKRISDNHGKKLPCGIFAVLAFLILVSYAMFLVLSVTNG
jgi:cation:H+ antiporter